VSDSYGSFVIVAVIAFMAPLLLALAPRLLVPGLVLELVAGIIVGPSVLDIAHVTDPVEVFSQVGLVVLLYLAGREIRLEMLTGRVVALSAGGWAISLVLGVAIGLGLSAVGLAESPLLLAVVLAASSLSIIVIPIRDAGESGTSFGQQVMAAAAVAEFGAVVLLAFASASQRGGLSTELVHLVAFGLVAVLLAVLLGKAERTGFMRETMERLDKTSAQIRVRGDIALLAIIVALAVELGLESVLAAFAVGIVRGMSDDDPRDRERMEIVSLGVFVPFFFVASGIQLDLGALFDSASDVAKLPLFLAALLVVRGLPALLYRDTMSGRRAAAAGLLQATSLSFIIVATQIGDDLGLLTSETSTALVGAGLFSVLLYPAIALNLIERDRSSRSRRDAGAPPGESGPQPPAPFRQPGTG
jgi:Kef-type K+ transport system membrane component KefB